MKGQSLARKAAKLIDFIGGLRCSETAKLKNDSPVAVPTSLCHGATGEISVEL
jgi:hypothetical protein